MKYLMPDATRTVQRKMVEIGPCPGFLGIRSAYRGHKFEGRPLGFLAFAEFVKAEKSLKKLFAFLRSVRKIVHDSKLELADAYFNDRAADTWVVGKVPGAFCAVTIDFARCGVLGRPSADIFAP